MTDKMPDEIYVSPDSQHTGTYCDVDDGGTRYLRADLAPSGDDVREAIDFCTKSIANGYPTLNLAMHIDTLIRAAQRCVDAEFALAGAEKFIAEQKAAQSTPKVVTVEELSSDIETWRFSNEYGDVFGRYLRQKYPHGIIIKPDAEKE